MSGRIIKLDEYNNAVETARRLYNAAESAWAELCVYLRNIENTALWRHGPREFNNFGEFMSDTFPAAFGEVAYRYRIRMIEAYPELYQYLDPAAARTLTRPSVLENPPIKTRVEAAICEAIKRHGVAPSYQVLLQLTNALVRSQGIEQTPIPRRVASIEEARALRTENVALKRAGKKAENLEQKCRRLEEENRRLKATIKELRAKLRAA